MKVLIVVDMQNDFINGALGTPEAVATVPRVKELIEGFSGKVIFTRDTHTADYLNTREGRRLPVEHCIIGSEGHRISRELPIPEGAVVINKVTFGSTALIELLRELEATEHIESVTLCGLCTDICVISNAMITKATLPEADVSVVSSACAGVTPESHERALLAMAACQIDII